jgi:DNA polymerase I-like protein with 3'-5' exonuclease and polymerase domains
MTREEAIQKAKILKDLIELNKVSKILDSFIPNFLNKTIPKQDKVYLHGNFNLGGTVSSRLSSSKPNLQQIPSTGSVYAKPIKKCFQAPSSWLMVGADFSSLEDRISALTTKDPNKLAVYIGLKQYDLSINGVTHRISELDVVEYDGKQLIGKELYELLQNSKS